jgi:hypothetical protein
VCYTDRVLVFGQEYVFSTLSFNGSEGYSQYFIIFSPNCLSVLHEAKDDITALHCKVVCLVQNSSFKEALNVMNNYSKLLGK